MTEEELALVPFAEAKDNYAWLRKRLKADPNLPVVSDPDLLQDIEVLPQP
jgi:hypothetical protein